ncbi:MAG: hypothetical protein KW806_00395 [Candidatus Yanofskybacteria bacterium]|nr:hypothetical protein [Candidatus Yanofskybacteria bacterium]
MKHLWLVVIVCVGCGQAVNPTAPETTGHLVFKASRTGRTIFVEPSINGSMMTVSVGGFLQHVINVRENGVEYLWEDDSQLPSHYTEALAYGGNPDGRLSRPMAGTMYITVSSDLKENQEALEALDEGVAILNRDDPDMRWEMDLNRTGNEPNTVWINVDPNSEWFERIPGSGALTWTYAQGSVITGGHILLRSASAQTWWGNHFPRMFAHELGHIRGLGHPPSDMSEGIMGAPRAVLQFSGREKEVMRNMFRRTPGNRLPDIEPSMFESSSSGPAITRLVCDRPL